MKKFLSILSVFILSASALVSCGTEQAEELNEVSEISETEEVTTETENTKDETELATKDVPSFQECHKTIDNSEKPEIIKVSFSGNCTDNIKKHASVKDLYNVNYLHSGVVGLVGIPVELTYDEEVTKPVISFTYNKDELRGIPEKNLIMLHYSEEDSFYNTMENAVLDIDNCTVSTEIQEEGVYLLVDAYQWYDCWGVDVSDYTYEVNAEDYPTDWERENDTGDIMVLADKEWAMENAPDFKVSTPEQLASVVWYVNGIDSDIYLTLENDIDLSGYKWKSMGWYSANSMAFSGVVDGQNHTINGLTIYEGYEDTGFIGYGLGVTVRDINFTNADISAIGCTGIVGGEIYGTTVWENISVSGKVNGGSDDYASIVGRESAITFKDCSYDVTVNGETFEYPSYRQKQIAETEVKETFTLTFNSDYTISRDDFDGFHNLCWHIERDGVQILERGAVNGRTDEKEMVLDTHEWVGNQSGKYTIYLVAFIDGTYIRVSNIIEYELPEIIE